MHRSTALAFVLITFSALLHAGVPEAYRPLVVTADFSFSERRFDLTEAVQQARISGRPLFIYVGAEDCAPCKQFSGFLLENFASLRDPLAAVVLVDVRTWMRGPKISFTVGQRQFSVNEFKARTGDQRQQFAYPYFWLLKSDLQQIRQLPSGSANYMPVERLRKLILVP